MAKINQEEYEVLKGLDDKWKWIARDDDLSVYNDKPVKVHSVIPCWDIRTTKNKWRVINRSLFQFIQWEDEEPREIAELIEEYETSYNINNVKVINIDMSNITAINYKGTRFEVAKESEETEVSFKEKLKQEIRDESISAMNLDDDELVVELDRINEVINQLDEPETLSREWIDDNAIRKIDGKENPLIVYVDDLQTLLVPKQEITFEQAYDKIAESFPATAKEIETVLEKYYSGMLIEFSEELHESIMRAFDVEATSKTIEALTGMTLEQIAEEARNGGIVPKQELPVIPKFVADWYESEGKRSSWWNWFYKWGRDESRTELETKTIGWMQDYNEELFIDIFRYGYEVEEERKYYVINNDHRMMLVRMMDGNTITEADPFPFGELYDGEKKSHRLTEQEIKDYDPRYWPFAVKVEELEE